MAMKYEIQWFIFSHHCYTLVAAILGPSSREITKKGLVDGSLKTLLRDQDFEEASNISIFRFLPDFLPSIYLQKPVIWTT